MRLNLMAFETSSCIQSGLSFFFGEPEAMLLTTDKGKRLFVKPGIEAHDPNSQVHCKAEAQAWRIKKELNPC